MNVVETWRLYIDLHPGAPPKLRLITGARHINYQSQSRAAHIEIENCQARGSKFKIQPWMGQLSMPGPGCHIQDSTPDGAILNLNPGPPKLRLRIARPGVHDSRFNPDGAILNLSPGAPILRLRIARAGVQYSRFNPGRGNSQPPTGQISISMLGRPN